MAETYRPIRPTDFDDLSAIAQDWSVVRQLGGWNWPYDPDQIRERSKPYEGCGFVWAICRADRLIGTLGITSGALGYMLHPAYHGQGIMTRAVRVALREAFADGSRDLIRATTWHDNPGSHAVLMRLGFVHWQTCYEHARARRLPTLSRNYRLTRAAWEVLEKRPAIA